MLGILSQFLLETEGSCESEGLFEWKSSVLDNYMIFCSAWWLKHSSALSAQMMLKMSPTHGNIVSESLKTLMF